MSSIENIKTEFEFNYVQKGEAGIESPPFLLPSKSSVAKAGDYLRKISQSNNEEIDQKKLIRFITILETYRSYHSYNISVFERLLNKKIQRLNLYDKCIISSRSKRFSSIIQKLKRFPDMKLSRMGDLAGVRIILKNMDALRVFVSDNSNTICELRKENFFCYVNKTHDYIETPKKDGYRSVHQVFEDKNYKLKLELQIRTQLQHEWATIVEILGSLMKTSFKVGQGDEGIRLFLKLCSALFSYQEDTPIIEEFNNFSVVQICEKIKELDSKLGVIDKLKSVSAIDVEHNSSAAYYLLILDLKKHNTEIKTFNENEKFKAEQVYSHYEQDSFKNEFLDVVLVSVDDVNQLKDAYPNYFLDTNSFINRMENLLMNR